MEVQNLKAFLANKGMTFKEFCQQIDCNYAYLGNVVAGRNYAGRRLARDVCNATQGIVKLKTRIRKKDLKDKEQQGEHNQQQNEGGTP